jgi:hypothetical protein
MRQVVTAPWEVDTLPTKVLGRRRLPGGFAGAKPLLELAVELRRDRPFVPRGLHRFATFEESEAWLLAMMTRPPRPVRPS